MQEHHLTPHIGIMQREPRKRHVKRSSSVWIGLIPIAVLAFWWLSTAAWGFLVTHVSDPLFFGSTHGNTITAVIGGGDSRAHPTTLTAQVTNGVVAIKVKRPSWARPEILTLLDLKASRFPDPTGANVELKDMGDHIQMTVLSTVWDAPFHRVVWLGLLVSDGMGNLKLEGG